MPSYLFIESRDPFETRDVEEGYRLLAELAAKENFTAMPVLLVNSVPMSCNTLVNDDAANTVRVSRCSCAWPWLQSSSVATIHSNERRVKVFMAVGS